LPHTGQIILRRGTDNSRVYGPGRGVRTPLFPPRRCTHPGGPGGHQRGRIGQVFLPRRSSPGGESRRNLEQSVWGSRRAYPPTKHPHGPTASSRGPRDEEAAVRRETGGYARQEPPILLGQTLCSRLRGDSPPRRVRRAGRPARCDPADAPPPRPSGGVQRRGGNRGRPDSWPRAVNLGILRPAPQDDLTGVRHGK
jgi:hypothetical protein